MKHTPGPWTTRDQRPIEGISFGSLNLKSVCTVQGNVTHVLAEMILPEEAALMAAAPDLLAALKLAQVTFERIYMPTGNSRFSSVQGTYDVICAAIAKAEQS